MTALLHGIRVLDLASVGPAARASRWLADYGAEVVKVGPVPRHGGVQITPPAFAYSGHRGMRRALFDLKDAEGRDAFLRLTGRSDVVIESFRPGVVDRLGIGYDDVREHNDTIVYCSTSGYGQDGPRSGWAGHDLNYLAIAGFLAVTQPRADGGPPIPGATVADSAGGGLHAVVAILAALVQRARTGQGAYLDVSVADGMLALMALNVDEYLATGTVPGPGHNILTGRYACYDTYPCADDRWLTVAAIEPHFWRNLCHELGLDQWVDHQTDDDVQDRIRTDLTAAFRTRPRDEWVGLLAPADTCVAPVLDITEVVHDEQYQARGAFLDARHPLEGDLRQVAPVLAGCEHGGGHADDVVDLPDPRRTDTIALLGAAGLSADEVDALREKGVVA